MSPKGSPTYPGALAALAIRTKDEVAARELEAIGRQLDDAELQSQALSALTSVAWRARDLDRAQAVVEERLEILTGMSAPDDLHYALMHAVEVYLARGMLNRARGAAATLSETVAGLTPHHRLHGAAELLRVEVLGERWDTIAQLSAQAIATAEANAATPCPSNATVLLYAAAARAAEGDSVEARRLEESAVAIGHAGYLEFESARLRVAFARDDMTTLRRLVDSLPPVSLEPWTFDAAAVLLDALVALDDPARVESEAAAWLTPGTYVEPFALRALGLAQSDTAMLEQAAARFDAFGLEARAIEAREALANEPNR
jgi:hypothetical protein